MHGENHPYQKQNWLMRSERLIVGTNNDSLEVNSFSKAGRKIGVGDCALFEAVSGPPLIGIVRSLAAEKEGNVKLGVNWLYRPGDIKLVKGAPLKAALNEVFYSFHKDEISSESVLHPCKVAFLQKCDKLPPEVLSFVCWRVYDTTNNCVYWLSDQDYTDKRQAEVDHLLKRTKWEMQATVQSGVFSQSSLSGLVTSQHLKAEAVNANQGKSKKRARTDQSADSSRRERSMKLEESDSGNSKREASSLFEEFADMTNKDVGLANTSCVDQLAQVMRQERHDNRNVSVARRTLLANIVAVTEREDCLSHFVQLGGLPVLDDWLQEAHNGKMGGGSSPREVDKSVEDLLLTLLRALDKLPVDLGALKSCLVGKSVNNLRSHRNPEIQKKARRLVDTWKKRVDADLKSSDEGNMSSKLPSGDTPVTKLRSDRTSGRGNTGTKVVATNGSAPGEMRCNSSSGSGCKEHTGLSSSNTSKDNTVRSHGSVTTEVLMAFKEEKSCSSSQSHSNSQSYGCGSGKGGPSWKEEVKMPSSFTAGSKCTVRSRNQHGKCFSASSSKDSQREHGNVKLKSAEKVRVGSSALGEKGTTENTPAENSNNQKVIVRLPNPSRSPARSVSGCPTSRASSPGSLNKCDTVEGKSKLAVHSPDSFGDNKSSSHCRNISLCEHECGAERSNLVTDDVGCKSLEAKMKASEYAPRIAARVQNVAEGRGFDVSDGGNALLASVVECTGSVREENASRISSGEKPCLPDPRMKDSMEEGRYSSKEVDTSKGSGIGESSSEEQPKLDVELTMTEAATDGMHSPSQKGCVYERPCSSSAVQSPGECHRCATSSGGSLDEGSEDEKKVEASTPTSLVRMPSIEEVGKSRDAALGYYEDDALEVARLVAKEVEQEVELYGKPDALDVNSCSPCKSEATSENAMDENSKNSFSSVTDAMLGVEVLEQERAIAHTLSVADGNQEGFTQTGKMCIGVNASSKEGADRVSGSFSNAQMLGEAVEVNKEAECQHAVVLEAAVARENGTDTATPDDASEGGKSGITDAPRRPVFDLNEGLSADEVFHHSGLPSEQAGISFPNATTPMIDSILGGFSSSLAAPIAIVAATKGAFIPPSNLLRSNGEFGWKGSAATSAFRPAEPRRTNDACQPVLDNCASLNGKRNRVLEIDLNVADERGPEEADTASSLCSQDNSCPPSAGCVTDSSTADMLVNRNHLASRLDLDLNRVGECDDNGPPISDCNKLSVPVMRVFRDFDLNDGLDIDDSMEVPAPPGKAIKIENSVVLPRSNTDLVNTTWYATASPVPTVVMPSFASSRPELSYPVVAAANVKSSIPFSHTLGPLSGDIYRSSGLVSSPSGVSFSPNMPNVLPYAGFPFGSGFPFTSATLNMGSIPHASSTSTSPFPAGPSQLVSAGTVVPPYGRSYPMGMNELSGGDTGMPWLRPCLDLNAGPDVVDIDAREEGTSLQMPHLSQLPFQQGGTLGVPLKRKEPESGFDPFRSGFRQMTWR